MPEVAASWRAKVVSPEAVLERIEPGMSIFLSTGVAEPRTLVRSLMGSNLPNLYDLELLQLVSLGDAVTSHGTSPAGRFRLKTFFSGWMAGDAITSGTVDLIPSRISRIPRLFETGAIQVDAAFLLNLLIRTARDHGIGGFTAAVLADNRAMIRVFEKTGLPLRAGMEYGVYHLSIPFAGGNDQASLTTS